MNALTHIISLFPLGGGGWPSDDLEGRVWLYHIGCTHGRGEQADVVHCSIHLGCLPSGRQLSQACITSPIRDRYNGGAQWYEFLGLL